MRHLTTSAFKIASGISTDSGSSVLRVMQQNPMPPAFTGKIVKAFLDTIYVILDGMMVLVAEEVPPGVGSVNVAAGATEREGKQELIDLRDAVRYYYVQGFQPLIQSRLKNTRLLLVISNFSHLSGSLIPSMLSQLENALGVSVESDRKVSLLSCCHVIFRAQTNIDTNESRCRAGQDAL